VKTKIPENVTIFDTTLRDGEQSPGVSLTPQQKVEISRALDTLGIDVLEAGFPITSEGEFEAVKAIANSGLNAEVCGLARTTKEDIDSCLNCDVDRVHTFIATSEIHMQHKLRMTPDQVVAKAIEAVEYCTDHGVKVEFSAEDASRTKIEFLKEISEAVTKAGASTINIPDTVGVAIPSAMVWLVEEVKSVSDAEISVHCHNDLGLAVANSLAAAEAGADQIQVCMNGVGERAGNAALEEVVVALKFMYGIETNIKLNKIFDTAELISRLMRFPIPANKPIIGRNAFAHESGIHTHAVITSPYTYEPISPEVVGAKRRIVSGKHSGGHGVNETLQNAGIVVTKPQLRKIVSRIKALGDKGIGITDADVEVIGKAVVESIPEDQRVLQLEELLVVSGTKVTPTATVKLLVDGEQVLVAENGVGAVDAAIKAIQCITPKSGKFILTDFRMDAITGGSEAVADAQVTVEDEFGNRATARGVSEDIVTAGVEATIEAVNKLILTK
jgi:isopropylmalate/citramalate/homocitrate synthase-like protein